jgi:hypothetical protein
LRGFAAADEGPRIDRLESLLDLTGNNRTGALGKRAEFRERIVSGDCAGRVKFDAN